MLVRTMVVVAAALRNALCAAAVAFALPAFVAARSFYFVFLPVAAVPAAAPMGETALAFVDAAATMKYR